MLTSRYTGCVYLATNSINGRCYVGKTIMALCDRKAIHCHAARRKASTSAFHAAIRKYGAASFQWSKLFESDDESLLFEAERSLIDDYRLAGARLYNIGNGGEGQSVPCSDERRRKARTAAQNRIVTDETRRKLSEAFTGRVISTEHRRKIADAKRGKTLKPWTEERRLKFATTWTAKMAAGYAVPAQTRAALSAGAKRRNQREGERERRRLSGLKGAKARWE
jgi:group I intron endonuclease